jgi:hypothetical protein
VAIASITAYEGNTAAADDGDFADSCHSDYLVGYRWW